MMSTIARNEKKSELIELVSEMNELIEKGFLKDKHDFTNWLQYSHTKCKSCYIELSAIVSTYMKFI